MTTILTYGTFDLFHIGHLRLLRRLSDLGDQLVVGISTDSFNTLKGKSSIVPYEHRSEIVAAIKGVSEVFPEETWDQKPSDIAKYGADVLAMGHDWRGKFDELNEFCEVRYLDRTSGISTTEIRTELRGFDMSHLNEFSRAVESLNRLLEHYQSLD